MNRQQSRDEQLALAWIIALALVCRLTALGQPMRYDEAVTWALFSGRSWTTIVTWYPFPNNHVLFSLFAKATLALSPSSSWALRLPALVAGLAIVPLTWAVGCRFADRTSALLAGALVAGSASLILFSTNARGYSIVAALFLVLLLLADDIRVAPSPGRWAAFATIGALGLYTIPVMLYPLGAVSLWLLVDAVQRPPAERGARIAGLALASAAAGAIALLLYLPIIRSSGLSALADNRFVVPTTWPEFLASLPPFLVQTIRTWTEPFPWYAAPIGFVLALVGLRRPAPRAAPSLAVTTLAWCGALLVVTHRVPHVRVLVFLLPLYCLAIARGLRTIIARLARASPVVTARWETFGPPAIAAVVVAAALVTRAAERSDDTGAFRGARGITALIAPRLRAGDRVLAPIPSNGPLLYYFAQRGLDTSSLNTSLPDARRAFLVLDPVRGQTIDWAIGTRMLDPRGFTQPVRLGTSEGAEVWETNRQ